MSKNDRFVVLRPDNCIEMRIRSRHNNPLDSFAGWRQEGRLLTLRGIPNPPAAPPIFCRFKYSIERWGAVTRTVP